MYILYKTPNKNMSVCLSYTKLLHLMLPASLRAKTRNAGVTNDMHSLLRARVRACVRARLRVCVRG